MSASKDTEDQRIGKTLQLPHEAIRNERLRFNGNTIMREVQRTRLEHQLRTRIQDLERVSIDGLEKLQGEIAAFRLALSIVTKEEQ